ncbi:hypothetical protein EYF80_066622 [Liparis tanakae]|uniref:Uncharacterized protein n=1 Tax=Liparis tanakae TaxID=230148 RepID=A0A4Z2E3F6_9TELE|nr:hypothetical protein EYF80_066622 [Liparis tanakae]
MPEHERDVMQSSSLRDSMFSEDRVNVANGREIKEDMNGEDMNGEDMSDEDMNDEDINEGSLKEHSKGTP